MSAFILPLVGGLLIGLASTSLLFFNGRVAGISGIAGGLLVPSAQELGWRAAFVGGLVGGGLLLSLFVPSAFGRPLAVGAAATVAAGLLVGIGTRLGNGCTSGHGVCGVSRGATRSIVATLTFMFTGAVTVFVVRHVLGAAQ